jgi:uncharacterized protein
MDQHHSQPTATALTIEGTRPVSNAERIKSIDAIRGFALLGILLMNIPGFGMNIDYWYYILTGPASGYDYYTFAWVEVFFDGTMRGLFSMLFGAGMVLFMTNKKEVAGQASVAVYYYRRLLWLVFFGVLNAFVILWQGDILFYYGLFGMVLFAFRKLAPKWLLIISLVCVTSGIIKSEWRWSESREKRANYLSAITAKNEHKKLTDDQKKAIGTWMQIENSQKPDTAEANLNLRSVQTGSYASIFTFFIPRNARNEPGGVYNGLWDMLAMMFLGMALFHWGFFNNKLRTSTYVMWLLIGYGLGIPIGLQLFYIDWFSFSHVGKYFDTWRINPWTFTEFRRIPIAIGHASLLMLVYRSGTVKWLMKALSCVGQMAFTNYLMQSVICTLFFFGYGFGYYGKLHLHQIYYVVFSVWIFQMIFSVIWLRYFRFGPFEWVWRSLTYWKRQPMKL